MAQFKFYLDAYGRPRLNLNTFCSYEVVPRFIDQPPNDLRKSNFFSFTIEISSNNHPVEIVEARFVNFLNENNSTEIRNGIKYKLRLRCGGESIDMKYLYLTLVDASTNQPVRYEGHDDSPKMQRVLLTHEAICTRCSLQKSCGNKNEAPSDPIVLNKGVLKFFLKCNQNCLKGAGNPRDMRRFAIAASFDDITYDITRIRAVSNKIFVHNNSKHNRKRKKDAIVPAIVPPVSDEIAYIHPSVGLRNATISFHSTEYCREGVSFKCGDGIQLPVTSIHPKRGMVIALPYTLHPGLTVITMYLDGTPVFSFPYEIQDRYTDVAKARPGYLFLLRTRGHDFQNKVDVGPNNSAAFVFGPEETCSYSFQNETFLPTMHLQYAHPHPSNYLCNNSSSTPSPEMTPEVTHMSGGSDSSPTYHHHHQCGY